ncbi:MAG: CCA tRNA nucleotidyltransferase [Alphaproteobacteria bacterium PRO2]|nr:CCA tRNA nucleotidyltransferase [Alphaproteobacteria bacterium PRO2]
MVSRETSKVMSALGEGKARFVGGCVRNMLLGEEVGDIDIATQWTPDQVTESLTKAGIRVVPTGIDHGTVTAIVDKKPYEITTLRKDIETDGRRAVVSFTEDWREDAQRRDFTINTLLADPAGNIYDPTGEGLKDLEARRVRFVGDPATRIAEDYLRILRFFRFHATYGKGVPDKDGLKACRAAAGKIPTLSKERITQEFFKILSVDNPVDILSTIFDNNILEEFLFTEYQPDLLKHLCEFQKRFGIAFLSPRLYVLSGLSHENIKHMERLLSIPKVFKRDIEEISEILRLPDLNKDHAVRVAVYKHGRISTAQALIIEVAQDRVINGFINRALEIIQKWDIPTFPVDGNDLMKAGIEKGPALGAALSELEDWWIGQEFKPDRKTCLARL